MLHFKASADFSAIEAHHARRRRARPDLSEVPTLAKPLFPISPLNFLPHFVVDSLIGGTALGTSPINATHFFVANHGKLTTVSRLTWVLSLCYSTISLLLPVAGIWILVPYLHRIKTNRAGSSQGIPLVRVVILGAALFGVLWFYLIARDAATSVGAWLDLM